MVVTMATGAGDSFQNLNIGLQAPWLQVFSLSSKIKTKYDNRRTQRGPNINRITRLPPPGEYKDTKGALILKEGTGVMARTTLEGEPNAGTCSASGQLHSTRWSDHHNATAATLHRNHFIPPGNHWGAMGPSWP
uniref:Uncharacterized protein n=1 Tax=Pyxicephalus adspersus TaxID=30357 RepID=A0AAV2ZNQ6_PYXAD|nr:TPA: hypothetical protein GDO54_003175 [Pyxicephalus adspersus]